MTATEFNEMISKINFNSFSDEDLKSISDTLEIKETEIRCIIIGRNHLRTHYPSQDRA